MTSPAHSGLEFTKIVATGNDFLFIDARSPLPAQFAKLSRADLAAMMCDRHFGAGADGVVFVEELQNNLKWDFYNNDGSHAEMCGNASRCMGLWLSNRLGRPDAEFTTAAGQVRTETLGADQVASHLDYLKLTFTDLVFETDGITKSAVFLNTGVPHAVFEIDDIAKSAEALGVIDALRFHPQTGPQGTNVTFLQILSPNEFTTVTFERGVEDFTLSCGTGVLAAAAVGLRKLGSHGQITLNTPGGTLKVLFGPDWQGAVLEGSAQVIYEGRFQLSQLQETAT